MKVVEKLSIGEQIKRVRTNKGLSQQDFAEATGLSRTYISDLENNRKSPSVKTLEKIAKKMNTFLYISIGGL